MSNLNKNLTMRAKVLDVFNELGIEYELIEHPPLFTCADDKKYRISYNGTVFKNLFLRNKKKTKYYLVSLPVDKRADLKAIGEKLNDKNLSFGSDEALLEKLNITTGAVSILNIIGVENTDVKFIIDETALKCDRVGFHPNDNTATLMFKPSEIEKIMNKYNADFEFANID